MIEKMIQRRAREGSWESKAILSFPSAVSQRIKTKVAKECTMPSKHGALYPRAVDLPKPLPLLILSTTVTFLLPFCWKIQPPVRHIPERPALPGDGVRALPFCCSRGTPGRVILPDRRAASRKTRILTPVWNNPAFLRQHLAGSAKIWYNMNIK